MCLLPDLSAMAALANPPKKVQTKQKTIKTCENNDSLMKFSHF